MKPKKVTVTTLSKELGVNASTVSRALNNSPDLSAETIARIRQKAEEYGFTTRQKAARVINICALAPTNFKEDCLSPFMVKVVNGMMEYLLEHNLEFSMYNDTFDKMNNGLLIRHLRRRNISGAVVINSPRTETFYEDFKQNRFPYVNLFMGPSRPAKNFFNLNNTKIGFESVDYLIRLGHRKIAILVTPPKARTGIERLEGYKKALKKANIPGDPALIWKAPNRESGLHTGYDAVMDLHRAGTMFTALFVMGENIALGALHALHTLKISIPEQVSLLTCDDYPDLAYTYPPLSVMDIPNRKFGYKSAERIHHMILGDAPEVPVDEPWMNGKLIIRDSTAPPPPVSKQP